MATLGPTPTISDDLAKGIGLILGQQGGSRAEELINLLNRAQEVSDITLEDAIFSQETIVLNSGGTTVALGGAGMELLGDADAVVGVSGPNVIKSEYIKLMNPRPIVFALSNPDPEILPNKAMRAGAYIVATGRSDFPNQINNALAFPGVFRGALDNQVREITDGMKIKAAYALASIVKKPTPQRIITSIFDKRIVKAIAGVIR